MAIKCAYCGREDVQITREHVVNKSFLDRYYQIGKGFANSMDRYTVDYLTVKDVCATCNNGALSQLDESFLKFMETNLPSSIIAHDSTFHIRYNFEDLSKWLLKTLYNSERKNGYEQLPKKLQRYSQYILGKDDRTKLFKIYVELLQDVPVAEIKKHGGFEGEDTPKLNFLRVGNEVMTTAPEVSIKYISTSNLVFHVFLLDVGQHSETAFKSIFAKFLVLSKAERLYYLDPAETEIALHASARTIIDILAMAFEGNKPLVQRMAEDAKKQAEKIKR